MWLPVGFASPPARLTRRVAVGERALRRSARSSPAPSPDVSPAASDRLGASSSSSSFGASSTRSGALGPPSGVVVLRLLRGCGRHRHWSHRPTIVAGRLRAGAVDRCARAAWSDRRRRYRHRHRAGPARSSSRRALVVPPSSRPERSSSQRPGRSPAPPRSRLRRRLSSAAGATGSAGAVGSSRRAVSASGRGDPLRGSEGGRRVVVRSITDRRVTAPRRPRPAPALASVALPPAPATTRDARDDIAAESHRRMEPARQRQRRERRRRGPQPAARPVHELPHWPCDRPRSSATSSCERPSIDDLRQRLALALGQRRQARRAPGAGPRRARPARPGRRRPPACRAAAHSRRRPRAARSATCCARSGAATAAARAPHRRAAVRSTPNEPCLSASSARDSGRSRRQWRGRCPRSRATMPRTRVHGPRQRARRAAVALRPRRLVRRGGGPGSGEKLEPVLDRCRTTRSVWRLRLISTGVLPIDVHQARPSSSALPRLEPIWLNTLEPRHAVEEVLRHEHDRVLRPAYTLHQRRLDVAETRRAPPGSRQALRGGPVSDPLPRAALRSTPRRASSGPLGADDRAPSDPGTNAGRRASSLLDARVSFSAGCGSRPPPFRRAN